MCEPYQVAFAVFPTPKTPTSVPLFASISNPSEASDLTACTCTRPSNPISPTPRVLVVVSKVKSTSPSTVPSPVHTPTWLLTGVPTFETSPEPAGVANVGATEAPFDLRNVPSAPSANSCTSPEASE